jgi:competence protein ComEC
VNHDAPAALPLIALIAGLALAPLLVNPWAAVLGLTVIFLLRPRAFLVFGVAGLLLSLHLHAREARERAAFAKLDPERFITVELPIEHDWAERDQSFVLRARNFKANGVAFNTPIAVYARFEPPELGNEAVLHAEGFLRLSDRGEYSLGVKAPSLLSYSGALPRWHPQAWNRALANRLEAHARDHPDEVALAQALLLGRGERLSPELRESFRRGGTYHLLVFSGLQIALAAALLALLLRWLHRPRASDYLLLVFSLLAPLFIGPTASVARASTGLGLYAFSRILKRPTSLENLWCVAAMLRLMLEPSDLTDVSFHLTYAGAGALLFMGKWFSRLLAAELAIAPLTLFHFHQYALGGTVITSLMSPLIFAMLVASAVACVYPPALAVIGALHLLCTKLNAFGFSGYFASPPLLTLIAGAFGVLLALAFLKQRRRAIVIGVVLLVPTVAAIHRSLSQRLEHPTVTFFDVGQGDAIAVRSGEETLLIDGGRDLRLLPLLADRGIRRIDTVVLTHAHPDHCASLPSVIEHWRVRRVLVTSRRFRGDCASELLDACSRAAVPVFALHDGQQFRLGAFTFTTHLADLAFRHAPENNSSVVLHATVDRRRFLFTGDIEHEAELTIADRDLRSDVLKVAHHGSRSSTTDGFLEQVAPKVAVISCGRGNLFGHPHRNVIDGLETHGVRTWRTDRDGSVDVEVREGRLYVRGGRD